MVAPAAGSGGDELPIDVDLIKVLASDTRRDILRLLGERRRTLTELADALDLKKATVLEHLKKLVEAGLIRRIDENERLWIYYELTPRGLRLVRPGRTRFYLIMAGAALACVVLGAVLVVALSPQLGGGDDSAARSPAFEDTTLDGVDDPAAQVVWRGLDADVVVPIETPARANGTLRVVDARSGALLELPVLDGAATLEASQIDALPSGDHALSLAVDDVEVPLRKTLQVRDPALSVFPRAAVAGAESSFTLAVAAQGADAPPAPEVRLDGTPLPLQGAAPVYSFLAPALAPGETDLEVGRLARATIEVEPDVRLAGEVANGTLRIVATDATGPLANVSLSLDGALLGATNESGALETPAPPAGEAALHARAADGHELQRPVLVPESGALATPAPRLSLSAFVGTGAPTSTRVHVEVRNAGVANETITLVLRDARGPLATDVLSAPALASRQVVMEAPLLASGAIEVEAYALRSGGAAPVGKSDDRATNTSATPATEAADGAPPAAPDADGASGARGGMPLLNLRSFGGAQPDARVTIATYPTAASPTPSASGHAPEPAVPGPSPLVMLALVAAAALAMRRRRQG